MARRTHPGRRRQKAWVADKRSEERPAAERSFPRKVPSAAVCAFHLNVPSQGGAQPVPTRPTTSASTPRT